MSLRYTDTYITDYGYHLIGKSIDGTKKIVWDEARTSSNNIDSLLASEIVALHRVNFESSFTCKGHVTKAVYNDAGAGARSVSLSCQLNGDSSSDGHGSTDSFVICAKLEDDPDSAYDVAIIARSGQGHVPEVIPGDGDWQADVSFILNLHDTSISGNIIAAPDSFYATASDLNTLSERVVTTHAEGSPTTGEAQTVYGQKTFKDKVVLDGATEFNGSAVMQNIIPMSDGDYNLGDQDFNWGTVYAYDGEFNYIYVDELKTTSIGTMQNPVSAIEAVDIYASNVGSTSYPVTDLYVTNIGSTSHPVSSIQVTTVGTPTSPVTNLYATTIGSQEHPVTNIYGTIQGDIDGTADRANKDGSGNVIADTYVTLGTPQTITGKKTFQNSILIDKSTTTPNNGLLEVYGADGISLKAKVDAYAEFMPFTEHTNQTGKIGTKFVWRGSSKQSFTTTFTMSGTAQSATISSIVTEPPKTGVWSIGTSSNKLNEVHANYFRGTADSATTATTADTAVTATTSNTVSILGQNVSGSYPLVFAESINASTSSAVSKALYTDTANTLYYNPNTNKLTIIGNWSNSGLEFRYSTSDTSVSTCISERSSNTTPGITADFKVGSTAVARIITDATVSDTTLTSLTTYPVSSLGAGKWSIGTSSNKLNEIHATTFYGALSGNATTATTATSAGKWTTSRNFYIATSDGTYTSTAVSVNGSSNVTLKLPTTIIIPSMSKFTSSNYYKVDVGCIFLACVKNIKQNTQNEISVGSTITIGSEGNSTDGNWRINLAEFSNNTGWLASGHVSAVQPGTYRFLSGLNLSYSLRHDTMAYAGTGLALMIRLS